MYEVRRLRQEKGWNQNELAFHADLAPSVISQIETGKREPSATTLRKLAKALDVEIPALFGGSSSPKAQAPPWSGESPVGRRSISETLSSYISRRVGSLIAELDDDNSPHFLNATVATNWVAGIHQEAKDWAIWAVENESLLMPQGSNREVYDVLIAPLESFNAIARRAERRIAAKPDQADEVAQKRVEQEKREAQESRRRLEELRVAS